MKTIFITVCSIALITAMMVMPTAAFEPGECDITVCASGCDYTSINSAVYSASSGNTVCVYNGTYGQFGFPTPNVKVKGEGADVVTVDCSGWEGICMPAGSSDANATGCVLEGVKVVNSECGLRQGLYGLPSPNCIIRNCVFDGMTADPGFKGDNVTIENCTFKNFPNAYAALYMGSVGGKSCNIIHNTVTNINGAALLLWETTNSIVKRNNFSSNGEGIELYAAGSGNKIYLNDIVDNTASVVVYDTPTTNIWNSTEQIEYVYGSTTYTNYLGNYWSPQYTGTDGDGDGIGDTDYDIPGSGTDKDYRPLMAGYESYLGEAAEDKPDLNVTAITTPASIIATQSNSIESTIANIGSADAGSFNVSLSANRTEIEEVNVTAGLGAGNSTEVTFAWTPAASGTYELCVVADCEGAVDESNETNNVTCMNVAVIVPPLTSITITPDTGITGQASAYNIIVNTTGFKSLTVTIPAGFSAKTPSDGEQIARVDLWWANEGAPHYGYVTFTANATDKMDVDAEIEKTSIAYPGMAVNYTEGATTSIKSPFGSQEERANLTLPQASVNGSLTISGLPETITNVTVSIGAFVQNPTNVGDYTFTAKAEGEAVGKSAAVTISAPAVPGIVSYAPSAAAISDTEDAARTFNVTVNQTVNVSWLVNGTQVQFNNTGGVTEASYTNTSAVLGTWNVSAVASNPNGTDMQTWIWTVEAPSPCFIATAAYGTSLHEDIDVLRDFRDERLMTNPLGRTFVKTYYETSPPIADALREHEGLRTAVRETLIKPLVYVSRMFITTD